MPFATAPDGVRLRFETIGSGEPLLLVAGQASDHHAWDGVRDDFAAHHRGIVFDHRWTGVSDAPAQSSYSTSGFAVDALAVLDQLGIARTHAYGISLGGQHGYYEEFREASSRAVLDFLRHHPLQAPVDHRIPAAQLQRSRGDL